MEGGNTLVMNVIAPYGKVLYHNKMPLLLPPPKTRPTRMSQEPIFRQPAAFLPIAMSLAALTTVVIYIALHGTEPQPDEGTAAHIWQILMALQVPIIVWFALRSVPQAPRRAMPILALQIAAALAAVAPIFVLGW